MAYIPRTTASAGVLRHIFIIRSLMAEEITPRRMVEEITPDRIDTLSIRTYYLRKARIPRLRGSCPKLRKKFPPHGPVTVSNLKLASYGGIMRSSVPDLHHIRMVGIDLDGTLLRSDNTISAKDGQALLKAAEEGIVIVPVTGRPLAGIPSEVERIPFFRYTITSNGAVTTDLGSQTACLNIVHAYETAVSSSSCREDPSVIADAVADALSGAVTLSYDGLPAQAALKVVHAAPELSLIREIMIDGFGYLEPDSYHQLWDRFSSGIFGEYIRRCRLETESYEKVFSLPNASRGAENVSFMASSIEETEALHEALKDIPDIRITNYSRSFLEVGSPSSDKGRALLNLGRRLGIPREAICAIGDSANDLPMLAAAGCAVAMGNASEAVRGAADCITSDNDHDGVAEVLSAML